MKIYTKTGDAGTTTKYDGTRVPKDHDDIVLVSKIDSALSSLDSAFVVLNSEFQDIISEIQAKLWQTAGEISLGEKGKKVENEIKIEDTEQLEKWIDKFFDSNNSFIRFRNEASVRLNEARIRVRELEVSLTKPFREHKIRPEIYIYVNRLSDLLFAMACKKQAN